MGPRTIRIVLTLAAAVGLAASGLLFASALRGAAAPGCGPGGWLAQHLGPAFGEGCSKIAQSSFSKLPGGIPVSAPAVAYFLAVLVAGLSGPVPTAPHRWAARAGALAAALYLGVAWHEGLWCLYCLACHAASLLIWLAVEISPTASGPRRLWISLAAFVLAAGVLSTAAVISADATRRQQQEHLAADEAKLRQSPPETRPSFAGRYTIGPADAKVRIVVFLGYQCPECQRVDAELSKLLAAARDVSLSVRHFPFCKDCNPMVPTTMHADGCRAALAAEAAGSIGGPAAFEKLHRWLITPGNAAKSTAEYAAAAGLSASALEAAMNDPKVAAAIADDVAAAAKVGLNQTPMVFVNNVELRAWSVPGALARAIEAARAAPASTDAPPDASARAISLWRDSAAIPLPTPRRSMGPANSPVRVTVLGSYQDDRTAEIDAILRERATKGSIRYSYLHYPPDRSCNPQLPRTVHPMACRFAQTAEAIGLAKGDDAFWVVHEWIFAHRRDYTDASLRQLLAEQGWPDTPLRSEAAQAAVAADITTGQSVGVRELPMILINDRPVPQWRIGDRLLLPELLDAAAAAPR